MDEEMSDGWWVMGGGWWVVGDERSRNVRRNNNENRTLILMEYGFAFKSAILFHGGKQLIIIPQVPSSEFLINNVPLTIVLAFFAPSLRPLR